MRVLVACEFSGIVRDAFIAVGHDAWSCDLLPTERTGNHIQGNVLEVLDDGWDLMIAHPPCTHLAVSGARHFHKKRKRQARALDFFLALLDAPIRMSCIENPVSIASSKVRKPDQIIQPWMFGHEVTKTTCLWLRNLPKLRPTRVVGRGGQLKFSSGKTASEWCWETLHLPREIRGCERSRTFVGIAEAMALQWGSLSPDHKEGLGLFFPTKLNGPRIW